METQNLANLYGTPNVDWNKVRQRLSNGLDQAPGTGGPDRHTCWLATIDPDGRPHVTGVGALWSDDAFWFETGRTTRKARNVERDPRCTLSMATSEFDLVVEGRATLVTDPGAVAALAAQWAEGGWPAEVDETGIALTAPFSAPSAGPPPWHVYRIEVASAVALQTVEPGGATRLAILTGITVSSVTETGTDWRVVDGVTTAWFDAPSLIEGAVLAGRIVELSTEILVDLRATGIRVRLASDEHAAAVSAAAKDLGLAANPAEQQQLSVVFESADPTTVRQFWQGVLDYAPGADGGLADPLRRDPAIRIRPSTEQRPLRNRVHLDVVRPAAAVEQAGLGEGSGPYGVCHSDPDGNEVDLVPGDPLGETIATADWQAVFSAMSCYRTSSPTQQRDLAAAAAALATDVGFPLLVDLRPGLVIMDSGKDQWETDSHGLELDFTDLAGDLQTAARVVGATADPALPRFAQLFLDAADVVAVRAFWVAALGYTNDRRAGVTDIHDPRRLNPVLVFQELDASDTERRRQRNRIHFELAVPSDLAETRLETILAAGGRLLDESDDRWRVADPEGNELVIVSGQ